MGKGLQKEYVNEQVTTVGHWGLFSLRHLRNTVESPFFISCRLLLRTLTPYHPPPKHAPMTEKVLRRRLQGVCSKEL